MRTSGSRLPSLVLNAASAAALALATLPACAQEAPAPKPGESAARPADRDETARDAVERHMQGLLSDDAATRERAAKAIVELGEPARNELDRITRDPDPKRAVAALKLLQSDAWERGAERRGRERRPAPFVQDPRFDEMRRQIDEQMEEMRRRMEAFRRDLDAGRWFDEHLRGLVPDVDFGRETARASSSGTVVENGRTFAWSIDETGRVKVTTRDGPGAEERTFEAGSLEELRTTAPDVAKRLDDLVSGGGRRFVLRWPPSERASPPAAEPRTAERGQERALRPGEEPLAPAPFGFVPPGPVLGVGTTEVPDVLRDQLDLPEGGLVIGSVTPGSLAAKLGIERNDVLLRVGDRVIARVADVRAALEAIPAGEKVTVEVLRKAKRTTLAAQR